MQRRRSEGCKRRKAKPRSRKSSSSRSWWKMQNALVSIQYGLIWVLNPYCLCLCFLVLEKCLRVCFKWSLRLVDCHPIATGLIFTLFTTRCWALFFSRTYEYEQNASAFVSLKLIDLLDQWLVSMPPADILRCWAWQKRDVLWPLYMKRACSM